MLAAVIKNLKQLKEVQADLLEIRLDDLAEFKDIQTPILLTYKNLPVHFIDSPLGNLQSYHNYQETPDLEVIYRQLQQKPAALYKIATFANSSIDTLKVLRLQKKAGSKLIAIAMGELGQPSRILGPIFGAPLVFAATDSSSYSAPGQYTLQEMKNYLVNPDTAIYGLIGDPVTQSISHLTHNTFFKKNNFNAVYVKFKVTPGELAPFLELAKELGFAGLSVTTPHKEAILPLLDEIDPLAQAIGAVNTLVFKEGKISGYNTDVLALEVIKNHIDLEGKKVQIFGAGGAARALIYGCQHEGATVYLQNRTAQKAALLSHYFQCQVGLCDQPDLAINCTTTDFECSAPLGMDINLRPHSLFLSHKEKIFGYEMFSKQAWGQFQLWLTSSLHKGRGGCQPCQILSGQ
jgi:3-dehydroquinate dehydratase/shikimate dehydrogenase